MKDEFYIGWEQKAAPGISKVIRRTIVLLLLVTFLVALALAFTQHMIGVSVFEWGVHKRFVGILQATPYPHLLIPRPGSSDGLPAYSTYYLVAPWKFGLKPEALAPLDGKTVACNGTLIYRDHQTMIEVVDGSLQTTNLAGMNLPRLAPIALGQHTFTGEIVDSKCFLGVMNPGQLATHRACAIRCISGGVPPVLLVRQPEGPPLYLLLVSAAGQPVNEQVLDKVAEPLQISGEVERQGDLLILRADPNTYRRTAN